MSEIEICKECDVPLIISRSFKWESNGVISLTMSPTNRTVFYEPYFIDNLFRGVEELIGISIDYIVIESRRRDVRKYMERLFSEQIELFKQTRTGRKRQHILRVGKDYNLLGNEIGRIHGYGKIRLSDTWEHGEDYPWRKQVVTNPYSMYFFPAEQLGAIEALEQVDMKVECKEIAENTYEFSVSPYSHPAGLKERLKRRRYPFKPGEIRYEFCEGCGLPREIADCQWNLDEGTIFDPATGRRMAIFGPWAIDAVLDDIEEELGESIEETVVESARRLMRIYTRDVSWKKDENYFNRFVGMRGLGNLSAFGGDRGYLTVTIQNSCMPLLMAGAVQAMVEMAYRVESSTCEWNLAEDGDLTVTVHV